MDCTPVRVEAMMGKPAIMAPRKIRAPMPVPNQIITRGQSTILGRAFMATT